VEQYFFRELSLGSLTITVKTSSDDFDALHDQDMAKILPDLAEIRKLSISRSDEPRLLELCQQYHLDFQEVSRPHFEKVGLRVEP